MVKLTKIYTRTGDDGTTGLGTGARVSKSGPRVSAYGEVDEANAVLGWAIIECEREASASPLGRIASMLRRIQNDLFDVGADLCVPIASNEEAGTRLRVTAEQTTRLERWIDEFNQGLPALTSFVLPGGTPAGAALHAARTVSRRAERATVALREAEPGATSTEVVRYLNRLSDLLFVLSRVANGNGAGDVLWVPGANRSG